MGHGVLLIIRADVYNKLVPQSVILYFRREVDENCASLGCVRCEYSWLLSDASGVYPSRLQGLRMEAGLKGCPETSVRNYHYLLRNSQEEGSSLLRSSKI